MYKCVDCFYFGDWGTDGTCVWGMEDLIKAKQNSCVAVKLSKEVT